jgi:SulP family sulfate permease
MVRESIHGVQPDTDEWAHRCAALALIVAVIQMAAGALRLGFLSRLVSEPVLVGFTSASAVVICATQVPAALGLPRCDKASGGECTVVDVAHHIFANINKCNVATLVLAAVCASIIQALRSAAPVLARRVSWLIAVKDFGALAVLLSTITFMK